MTLKDNAFYILVPLSLQNNNVKPLAVASMIALQVVKHRWDFI